MSASTLNNANNLEPLQNAEKHFKLRRLFLLFFCFFLILSLLRHSPEDIDYLAGGLSGLEYPKNLLGVLGARLAWFMLTVFGLGAYFIVGLLSVCCLRRLLLRKGLRKAGFDYLLSIILAGISSSLLFGLFPDIFSDFCSYLNIQNFPGGIIGNFFCAANSGWLYLLLNWTGSLIVTLLLLSLPLGIIVYYDWQKIILFFLNTRKNAAEINELEPNQSNIDEETGFSTTEEEPGASFALDKTDDLLEADISLVLKDRPAPAVQPAKGSPALLRQRKEAERQSPLKEQQLPLPVAEPASSPVAPAMIFPERTSIPTVKIPQVIPGTPYQLPGKDLLHPPAQVSTADLKAEIVKSMNKLQETLDNFGIDAEVIGNIIGPQVTLFEISPAAGVNITRFGQIQDNIRMALEATSIRMLLPIPGRNLVGIEVPNPIRTIVSAHELLSDSNWTKSKMDLPVLLGKNINGETKLLDLAGAPHLLIAGATGSGKSVCMNMLITSMLFRFKPEELKLIMADPKVVEFLPYSKLPHLIVPVITEAEKVSLALRWAVNEMERRYKLLGAVNVRNLKEFNNRRIPAEPQLDDEGNPIPEKLPFIVVIIDEIADVMLHAQKDVEKALSLIVAKSRAVGIHTIIATQRPDTKVITGTIKNNYPVRIAFQVPSQVDARTIMDTKGAESLLGKGDMLFKGIGVNVERIQGGWVDTKEVKNIVEFVSAFAEPEFDENVVKSLEGADGSSERAGSQYSPTAADKDNEEENLIQSAIEIILRDKRPTISYLQRSLKIGYNRAAAVMDELEDRGIIGPQPSSGQREILVYAAPEDEED